MSTRKGMPLVTELEQIVAKLRTQVQTIAAVAQARASTSSASARSVSSSDGTPQTFNMSVDDDEAEEPPNDTPEYDITDTRFGVLKGKVDDNLNELLNSHYRKAQKSRQAPQSASKGQESAR